MLGLPNYCADFERQYDWTQIGNLSTEQTALGVDGRDNASVAALTATGRAIWTPDDGTAAAVLRFRVNGSENNTFQVLVYGAKGADYYTLIADLTLIQGTQDWSSGHFVDSISVAEQWCPGLRVSSKANEIGMLYINTAGFDRFVFISPDCLDDDIDNVYIDASRLDLRLDKGVEVYSVLTAVEAGTSNLESQMETQESQLETLESELISIEADTDNLQSQLETNESQMETLESELITIETEQSAQGLSLDSIVADGTQLQSQLETQESQLETTETQLTAIDSGIVNIVTNTDGLESQLETNESQMETNETQLTAIDSGMVNTAVSLVAVDSELVNIAADTTAATFGVSSAGGTEKLTIPATPFQVAGSAQTCREVIIYVPSGNTGTTYLQIGGVADANDLQLQEDVWLPIAVNNTNLLNFFGTENDVVHLLWRN